MQKFLVLCLMVAVSFVEIHGHGMLLDPPNRSSRWRFDPTAPHNYDDSGLFCGGLNVQHNVNGGKCGLCGDDYRQPRPRDNELGGIYGQGTIVKTYYENVAMVNFKITANHLGYISFDLCNLDKDLKESEDCFKPVRFVDGSDKFYIGTTLGMISTGIVFPSGTKCEHCVLRWTYTAGNNWGICPDGKGAEGCGPQETFKNCADITIKV